MKYYVFILVVVGIGYFDNLLPKMKDTYGVFERLWRRSGSGPAAGFVVLRHGRLLVRVGVHVLVDVLLLVVAAVTVPLPVSPMVVGVPLL